MAIYAISDLHLSFAQPKPMDMFGPAWTNHPERIRANWEKVVKEDDTVLMPGDLSWAMRLPEAMPDLDFVADLPGRKILIRGNHDFWWDRRATTRIQRVVDKSFLFLQGTSVVIDEVGVTGTRGWRLDWEARAGGAPGHGRPAGPVDDDKSARILQREMVYLENGLRSIPDSVSARIAMLHFPPFDEHLQPNEFAELLSRYSVDVLVYGHVHLGLGGWLEGIVQGVRYYMVAADVVGFVPQPILPEPDGTSGAGSR